MSLKSLFAAYSILTTASAFACPPKPIVVAIIDTGFGLGDVGHDAKLCRFGHKDFTVEGSYSHTYDTIAPVPRDGNGHGTNIAGTIGEYADKGSEHYCLVIIKYWSEHQSGAVQMHASTKALKYANDIGADVINFSGGGGGSDPEEIQYTQDFLDRGGIFVAAAGNDNNDLNKVPYYPAMNDFRIIVVGNKTVTGLKSKSSNYGAVVKRWEVGEDVTAYGVTLTGTSQATAVATGKIVSKMLNQCDKGNRNGVY